MNNYYEIKESDINKIVIEMNGQICPTCHGKGKVNEKVWLSSLLGRIIPNDVGKRIYLIRGELYIENQEQYLKRIGE